MAVRLKLNRLEIVAIMAVVVTSFLCIWGTLDVAEAYLSVRPMPPGRQMLGLLGWFVATFGPIAAAAGFWRFAKRVRKPWLLHLLFFPCAFALLRAGAALMLLVIGDPDFDATLGGPVLQAGLLFAVAVAAYLAALVSSRLGLQAKRADR
jgi:hypothetical protein